MIKPLCIIIMPDGKATLIGDGAAWETRMANKAFCAIIWFKKPTEEQLSLARRRMKIFLDPKEMTAIPYVHEELRIAPNFPTTAIPDAYEEADGR